MVKKFFIIISCICTTLVGCILLFSMLTDTSMNDMILRCFGQKVEEDIYTQDNISSFKAQEIKGYLEPEPYNSIISNSTLLYGNDVVQIPIPSGEVYTTYSDTVYSSSGSVYIVLSKDKMSAIDKGIYGEISKFLLKDTTPENLESAFTRIDHLGWGKPVVIEVTVPNSDSLLYIQCYTPEVLGYYLDYDWKKLETYKVYDYNFEQEDDYVAATIEIPEDIIPEEKDMFLEDVYCDIVSSYRDQYEGYSDFIKHEDYILNYYRAVGFLETHMKIEYAKMKSMGYIPTEFGWYNDMVYIKCDDFIVLGSKITNNTCLIYHVTKCS